MTPRDVLKKFAGDDYEVTIQDREEFADQVTAALKAAGLFIGPLVATEDMRCATFLHQIDAGAVWETQVEVWTRTVTA
jgi:hypothetical protein